MKKLIPVLIITVIAMSAYALTAQQSRSLTVEQYKNSPVEVVSIKLGDENIKPKSNFTATPTWTDDLKITVRNDSEELISFIEVQVAVYNMAQRTTELSAHYVYGQREGGTERLAPGETEVLTKLGETLGDPSAAGLIRVMPLAVRWNGDASREWHGGHMMYRDPDNPKIYRVAPRSKAYYQFPKGYQAG